MLERVSIKALWFICSYFADAFVKREALQRFDASSEVVSYQKVAHIGFQLFMKSVVVAFNGYILDRSIHTFDLTIRLGMFGLCEPVFNVPRALQHRSNLCTIHCAVGPLR